MIATAPGVFDVLAVTSGRSRTAAGDYAATWFTSVASTAPQPHHVARQTDRRDHDPGDEDRS